MSGIAVGGLIFACLMVLLVLRVPIGIAMFTMGAAGYVYLTGGEAAPILNFLKNLAYARLSNYDIVVIPLFLLMGQFATHGGLSASLFGLSRPSWVTSRAAWPWLRLALAPALVPFVAHH